MRWIQHHLHGVKSPTSDKYNDPRLAATVTPTASRLAATLKALGSADVVTFLRTKEMISSSVTAFTNNVSHANIERTVATVMTPMCFTHVQIANKYVNSTSCSAWVTFLS